MKASVKRIYPDLVTGVLFWFPVFVLTGLLSFNALHYYTFRMDYGILPEKTIARNDVVWMSCFYLHMITGVLCLFTPLLLFTGKWFRIGVKGHRWLGKMYILVTLLCVCPTGFYMSIYAKGGMAGKTGFVIQGILLMWFTWKAYREAIRGNYQNHASFMVRSYAIATAALTFRLYHILFYFLHIPYEVNYATSQWVSILGNLFIAEVVITLKHFTKSPFNR